MLRKSPVRRPLVPWCAWLLGYAWPGCETPREALARTVMPLRRTLLAHTLAASLTLGTLVTLPASADPLAQVTMEYQAPAECPPEADLMALLKQDLAGSQVLPRPLRVSIEFTLAEGSLWRGTVQSLNEGGTGERTLSARDCASLAEAASLVIAMQIDPETAGSRARSSASSDVTLEGAPLVEPSARQSSAPESSTVTAPPKTKSQNHSQNHGQMADAPRPSTAFRFPRLGAAALAWGAVDYGSLPSLTGAFGGAVGLLVGRGRFELGMGYYLPRNRDFDSGGVKPVSATFSLWETDARGCVSLARNARFAMGPCAGFQLARRRASAPALADPQTLRTWDLTLLTGLDANYSLTRSLGIRGDLDFLWALAQPRFGFLSDGEPIEVFRPAKAQIRLRFGLELRFF